MHGSEEMREREKRNRNSVHQEMRGGCKELEKVGGPWQPVEMQPNAAKNRHFEVDTADGYMD
jgi:hypothetical protein